MKLVLMAVLLVTGQTQPETPGFYDQPIGALRGEGSPGPLDRMTLNQMMRMSTLPAARMREMQCAGVLNWTGSQAWPVFAVPDTRRKAFVDQVATALAHDLEIEGDVATALIEGFSLEPPYREEKGELPAWRADMEQNCRSLVAAVRADTYHLAPLAQPSVVDPGLASCYARYTIAADAATDEKEASGLRATAAKAENLALAGKVGDARAAAQAALKAATDEARVQSAGGTGDPVMQLVVCLPPMRKAEIETSK